MTATQAYADALALGLEAAREVYRQMRISRQEEADKVLAILEAETAKWKALAAAEKRKRKAG